jgi:hypothetical protein
MVKVKDLSFSEPKKLPTIKLLYNDFGIILIMTINGLKEKN